MVTTRDHIPLAEWAAAGRHVVYRGYRIFVREAGKPDAEPLLLIHGFPTASWDWEAVWPRLAERFHLYALDLIGFGLSDKPVDYAYSLFDQANLCEALLAGEGVRSYHVLAHDYGDSVAQELLARQREPGQRPALRSVAFLNGGLFPETHRPVLVQRLLLSRIGPLVSRLTSRASLARNLCRIFGPETPPDDELVEGFWFLLQAGDGRAVMPKLIRYMVERREHRTRWVTALQASCLPLKLIDGALDPVSGRHMVDRYRELIPGADVTLLGRIGHYPQLEAPEEVVAAYLEFRARLDARGYVGE